jgi:hypothetical protein
VRSLFFWLPSASLAPLFLPYLPVPPLLTLLFFFCSLPPLQTLTRRESELKEGLLRKKVLASRGQRSSGSGGGGGGAEEDVDVKEE